MLLADELAEAQKSGLLRALAGRLKGMGNADFITAAAGFTVPLDSHVSLSVAYERPITSRKDIEKQRVTTSVRFEF